MGKESKTFLISHKSDFFTEKEKCISIYYVLDFEWSKVISTGIESGL